MMGRDLVPVKEVVAGNVFAVAGLEGFVGRSATLCSPSAAGFGEDAAVEKLLNSSPDAECIINLGRVNQQVWAISRFYDHSDMSTSRWHQS